MDGVAAFVYFNKPYSIGHMGVKKYYFFIIWQPI